MRTWDDRLTDELAHGSLGAALARKYGGAFSPAYQAAFSPDRAIVDIAQFEALDDTNPVAVDFYRKSR